LKERATPLSLNEQPLPGFERTSNPLSLKGRGGRG
jgi:hypothetical protein